MSIEEYLKTLKYPENSKFKKYVKTLNSLGIPVSVEQYKIYIEYIKETPYARMKESTFIARYGEAYYYDIMLKQRADVGHSREKCIERYGEILGNEKYETPETTDIRNVPRGSFCCPDFGPRGGRKEG